MGTFPDDMNWFILPLNPEPWAVGPLSVGRRAGKPFPIMGRNQQLYRYQEAVREELLRQRAIVLELDDEVDAYELVLMFHQVLESYQTQSGRTVHDKEADLTNLVKATEDAIQGVLIENDRAVRKCTSYVERSAASNATPYIVIGVAPYVGIDPGELPSEVWAGVDMMMAEQRAEKHTVVHLPDRDIF